MLLIREVFHCRPGKVRPLLEKFQAMNRIMANAGRKPLRSLIARREMERVGNALRTRWPRRCRYGGAS